MCLSSMSTKSSGEKSNCTYLRGGQKNGTVLWCMSDNTRNHQMGDEGRTLPCPGKTELNNVKDT